MRTRVDALVESTGARRVWRGNAMLAVWAPSILEGGSDVDLASSGRWASHPRARCVADGALRLDAGPLPQYPLYYTSDGRGELLVACSRLASLLALLPEVKLSTRRLVCLLSAPTDIDSDATAYQGVKRLRPCESVVADRNGVHVERVFPHIAGRYRRGRPQDLAAEFRHRLDAAVDTAVGASRRVAVLVSGGLDSSGVLSLAAARFSSDRALTAISVQYAAPGDDRPYFAEVVRALKVHAELRPARDAGLWFRQSLCADAQPVVLGTTCLDMLQCATASAWSADVTLSGVSGDRVSGGPLPYAQLARRGHILEAVRGALRVRVPWSMSASSRLREFVVGPLLPRWMLPSVWWPPRRRRCAPPEWMTRRSAEIFLEVEEASANRSRVLPDSPDAWMKDLCSHHMLPDMADLGGQVAAVTGCAPVDVFLNHELVRFVFELDPQILSYGDEYRGLYRLAMRGILPEKVRTRQSKARYEPAVAAAAAASNCMDELRGLATFEELGVRGLVEPAALRASFNEWLAVVALGERDYPLGADARFCQIWDLLTVEAFLREHGRGRQLA
jgi:hypothetical protein